MAREPVTLVEIDMDRCSRVWGVGACTAALGATVPRKCFNTFATCHVKAVFTAAPFALRFAEPRANMPAEAAAFPAVKAVSAFTATVNIAGSDDRMSALGRRATVAVTLQDFLHHDRCIDPYQAERVSGAAQNDEPGYDPAGRGSFFSKLRARWPHYTGRALRVIEADIAGGVLSIERTRHFVITDMSGPDDDGVVRIEAKDVLDLAGNDRALAPAPSRGVLSADVAAADLALTLTPAGVGAEYPASGRALIGAEIVSFARSGDAITIAARGLAGTGATDHKAGDTFQAVLHFDGVRVDDALEILLRDYAKVPAAFIPKSEWAAEVSRWMPAVLLRTHICQPTGVAKLIGELAVLGVSIWWDDVAQKIGMKPNRPATDGVTTLTEMAHIKAISPQDRNEDRLTEILFHSVQIDPTKSATSSDNYRRSVLTVDMEAKGAQAYGDTRLRRIYCRWFNDGADTVVQNLSKRLLHRFRSAPIHARITLDAKDAALGLTDVVSVESRIFTDDTGKPAPRLMQIISRSDPKPGHEIEIVAQAYDFSGRYGVATENTRPTYSLSTGAQKASGLYAVDPETLLFPDGSGPYVAS